VALCVSKIELWKIDMFINYLDMFVKNKTKINNYIYHFNNEFKFNSQRHPAGPIDIFFN